MTLVRRVALVIGTRPEATKTAPLVRALAAADGWEPCLISTDQHGPHVADALAPFGLRPDVTLRLARGGEDLVGLNGALQHSLGTVLEPARFDAVVVQGDTATTLAGALVAHWRRIPLVHLEAGLRTGDLAAPFPEEGNRRMVGALADVHLAPTPRAAENLRCAGVDPAAVEVVGNSAIDAVRLVLARAPSAGSLVPEGYGRHVVVTAHRRESWGPGIRRIAAAVRRLAEANPDCAFLIATHMNPAVQRDLRDGLGGGDNIVVLPPLAYEEFVPVLAGAELVLTDSGGIQEEAPALDVPVLVLRETTERPEGVDAGCARLVGTDEERIVAAAQQILSDPHLRSAMASVPCPYGDGHAAERSVEAMARRLRVGGPPAPVAGDR